MLSYRCETKGGAEFMKRILIPMLLLSLLLAGGAAKAEVPVNPSSARANKIYVAAAGKETAEPESVAQIGNTDSLHPQKQGESKMKCEELKLTSEWDKTFPKSDKVEHSKVTFVNRYGITLAADLYVPINRQGKLPAIAVCGPFGAVKEQCSGLYAQTLAERGFVTLAFDPSFTGESGGSVRYMASPDINTEDFMAAVDYLSMHEKVDPNRIGMIGICGWGGMAINAAALDTRVKATAAMTMYDMTRVNAKGYFDVEDNEEARYAKRSAMCAQRLEDLRNGEYKLGGGVIDPLPEDAPSFIRDYYDYYKTPRGYHARSLNSNGGWNVIGCESFINQPILQYSNEIRSAVLIVHGSAAHSCYFGKDAYANMIKDSKYTDNKELLIIPDVSHTDLYDGGGKNAIPFDKLEDFFTRYLQ